MTTAASRLVKAAGRKTLRLHTPGAALEGREQTKSFTTARDGFSLNAAVACKARERRNLERLSRDGGGLVVYELRNAFRDGTTRVCFTGMYECRGRQAGIAPAILLHFRQPWRSDAASGLFEPLELMAHIPVRHPSGDDAELARATNCDSIAEVAPMSERAFWGASISARTMQLRLTCRNRARDSLRQ